MNTAPAVSNVRSIHTTLLDDSVGHGDYLKQLTSQDSFEPGRCRLPMTY